MFIGQILTVLSFFRKLFNTILDFQHANVIMAGDMNCVLNEVLDNHHLLNNNPPLVHA